MDDQKRQKVMLGVLAACALGAIGYYGFIRDSGSASVTNTTVLAKNRKKRVTATKTESKRRTRTRVVSKNKTKTRRRVDRGSKKHTERRRRGVHRGGIKKKRKKMQPAA